MKHTGCDKQNDKILAFLISWLLWLSIFAMNKIASKNRSQLDNTCTDERLNIWILCNFMSWNWLIFIKTNTFFRVMWPHLMCILISIHTPFSRGLSFCPSYAKSDLHEYGLCQFSWTYIKQCWLGCVMHCQNWQGSKSRIRIHLIFDPIDVITREEE